MDIASNMTLSDLIPYCIFPNSFIRNGKISSQQKVLFEILCSYDHVGSDGCRKGWCDPSLDKVSQQLGLKKRATQIHLKRLVENGMVTIIYRNNSDNDNDCRTSIYILNIIPGLSDADRKRIARHMKIEIKNIISGLNTIKIQTAKGMQYVSEEEFDLEYLITGNRSSTILEGEFADPEDIISTKEESKVKDEELYKPNIENEPDINNNSEFTFKAPNFKKGKPKDKSNYNSTNVMERIQCGNYFGVTAKNLCFYFKQLYEITYPGEIYIIEFLKDVPILRSRIEQFGIDTWVGIMEYFIRKYEKLFFTQDYPRPRIYQLNITWILNKLNENYLRSEKASQEMKFDENIKNNAERLQF